jgi:hypothetical protein
LFKTIIQFQAQQVRQVVQELQELLEPQLPQLVMVSVVMVQMVQLMVLALSPPGAILVVQVVLLQEAVVEELEELEARAAQVVRAALLLQFQLILVLSLF